MHHFSAIEIESKSRFYVKNKIEIDRFQTKQNRNSTTVCCMSNSATIVGFPHRASPKPGKGGGFCCIMIYSW